MFHNGMFGGGMWFGWIFWIVLVSIIIYFIYRNSEQKGSVINDQDDSSLDILKRRYANGEVDKEEFLRIRNDLETV